MTETARRRALIALPPLLIVTMLVIFQLFVRALGLTRGYLAGFLFYWMVWCAAVPLALLDRSALALLWQKAKSPFGQRAALGVAALVAPLVLGYGYAFPRAVVTATPAIVLASAALAAVNAPLEELLWRGCYGAVFGEARWLGYVYPNLAFGLWHIAPLSVVPNRAPGGTLSFVAVSTVIGLLWGWVVQRTGSLRATALAHILFDFSGLGGRIYFS